MSCMHGNSDDACDICDEVDAAWNRGYEVGLARAKAGGGVDGWRTIESAPGGEVDFQAWFKADDSRYESYWHPRCKLGADGRVYEYGRVDFDIDDYEVRYGYTATHWMPLPSPPKEDGE